MCAEVIPASPGSWSAAVGRSEPRLAASDATLPSVPSPAVVAAIAAPAPGESTAGVAVGRPLSGSATAAAEPGRSAS